jgi:arabinose-5-phosphate isomerase
MAPTNSTTATMAMGDALAMVMIDVQSFDRERYALNHPAGAIGRALVLKVSDVMRTGDRYAKVAPETTVLDTLLAMTKAQGGSAVVVNPDGTLAGIFTDGDFRRGFAAAAPSAAPGLLAAPVADHMTRHPLFVHDTAYAVDLLRIFEKRRVDDLPVCDDAGRVVGLVDIQDLPKLKVL